MSGTNTGSNDRSGFNDNLKINKVHRKQFEQPTFRSREFDKTTPYEQDRLNQTDTRIGRVLQSAKKKDTLESRMKEYLRTAVGRSSWLSAQAVPEKDLLDAQIDDATKLFSLQSLSDSQKTKRGEKFRKKAEQQAKMINLMQTCRWQRKDALKDLLEHGKNARIGTDVAKLPDGVTDILGNSETFLNDLKSDTFLKNVGEDIDDVSVMMRDVSFYFEQQRTDAKGIMDTRSPEIFSYHYEPVELIADPKTRNEGYLRVISELKDLDLSKFEYKDNDEFMTSTGKNSFVKRYAELRVFSHARKMLDAAGKAAYDEKTLSLLYSKAALAEDILRDYEYRSMLIQSPYYVLLAGKDFDSLSDDDLNKRIRMTDDPLAKAYLRSILHQRSEKVFKKGSSTKDLLKEKQKELLNNKLPYPEYTDQVYESEPGSTKIDEDKYRELEDDFEEITRDEINELNKTDYIERGGLKKGDRNKDNWKNRIQRERGSADQTITGPGITERRKLYMEYKEGSTKEALLKKKYIHERQDPEELKETSSIGATQGNNINSIEASLRRHYRDAYKVIDKKRSSENDEDRKADLFHAEGTRLLENEGHDVLEIDVGGSGFAQFVRAHNGFDGLAESLKNIDEYEIQQEYGDRYYSEKDNKAIDHVRWKAEEGEKEKAKGKFKYRYTIAGPTPEGILMPGAANVGEYKIENTIMRILEIGQLRLGSIFAKWEEEDRKAKEDPDFKIKQPRKIDIMLRGHSRGGVGVSLGAMKLNHWLHTEHEKYAGNVVFHLTQYDPVPGTGSDYGGYEKVDHLAASHTVRNVTTKDDPEFKPLGENAETTVVYSINTQYSYFFTPQTVLNAKRIIITPFNHSVGQILEESDASQLDQDNEKIRAMSFYNAETGDAYRQSGLDRLDEGVYIMDEKHVLIRINSLQEYILIMREVVPKSEMDQQLDRQIALATAIGSKFNVTAEDAERLVRAAIKGM